MFPRHLLVSQCFVLAGSAPKRQVLGCFVVIDGVLTAEMVVSYQPHSGADILRVKRS